MWRPGKVDANCISKLGIVARVSGYSECVDSGRCPKARVCFPLFVTREFASRMEKGNLHDPLLAQVLPRQEEAQQVEGFLMDPVGDGAAEVVPGLLHKYHGRALMIATGACAVHCRYCFRRHYPYQDAPKSIAQFEPAFDYLRSDHSIHEIILSGGDPLTLVDSKLGQLVEQFEKIDSLQRLRIHTRLPIMIPQRVSRELLELIERSRLATWIVLHSNHARELDDQVAASILRLRQAGAVMLNQAVLLRGVNDSVELKELSLRLVDMGVVPYYLHQLDPVQGAAHFQVPIEAGRSILGDLAKRLPGFAVPKYVAEYAGQAHKQLL